MKSWIHLPENEFLALLKRKAQDHGNIGEVFPAMVMYNVPIYLMKQLWADKYEAFKNRPVPVAFLAAEDNWNGKIDNISSKISKIGDRLILNFQKSYVMESELLLILTKYENGFAVAWVTADPEDAGQDWISRKESDIQFKDDQNHVTDHFRVTGESSLSALDILPLTKQKYARFGLMTPRREFTGLAVIASGLLEKENLATEETRKNEEIIISGRMADRISGEEMKAASGIFQTWLDADCPKHPFWTRARKMFARMNE